MAMFHSAEVKKLEHFEEARDGFAPYKKAGKRVFDLVLALALMPVLVPLIAVLWVLTKRDGGSGFFGHRRVGRNGKVFRCWKLRTMVVDAETKLREHLRDNPAAAEEWARDHKLDDDPRITRLGRFLRKTSLDELPQIWNVIRGEMSFVGPRPIVRVELHKYGTHRPVYLSMTPGITGLWQVSGRNDVTYDERVNFDVEYAKDISLLTDLRLIAKTGLSVVGATGR
ncbi:exopolysaccharide biosynthesis protein [Roseobacter denitrificans]|uniref:Sugar transferase domain protein n=1 Tax=Roseobacter denitrificans (strain ATCC 33942 / OCh 114) TaxID=375451 RepID=Q161M8_ROSDO|nr:sugar transferase [Roseobacter denitrificans]ABG33315.1 sugar transferase domain protein [Roseobacter denitrificans OCh 114]AVL52651.1 exopolysaccharide biosynthesis protein [Roseobacter denitrificans]SFG22765.1 Sugar transferase involved in LPS biosynthesis (colanic, teichoic acid) [Roseobacter denitrificans OCh 114]